MFRISCSYKSYDWGKLGAESEVYKLLKGCSEKEVQDGIPYAELWMGTHPSGPSSIYGNPEKLLYSYIVENPGCIGNNGKFGKTLPFLFKVLSVRKALSIQAHPAKKHAEALHRQRPDEYPDANHKPELAIALTTFEALLAFRPVSEIACFVQGIPELLEVIGSESAADLASVAGPPEHYDSVCVTIKAAFEKLMRADQDKVSECVNRLGQRLSHGDQLNVTLPNSSQTDLAVLTDVFLRLVRDYPGDCGCFSLFFMNYIQLEPGQAVFLEANLPHAYISGDCVECMACSDNVVRAGLTPKYKDVDCLLGMLTYEPRNVKSLIFPSSVRSICKPQPTPDSPSDTTDEQQSVSLPTVTTYAPPVEEFAVDRIWVPSECELFHLFPLPSASILIIISGSGRLQVLPPQVEVPDATANYQRHQSSSSSVVINEAINQGEESKSPLVTTVAADTHVGCVNRMLDFSQGMVFFVPADVAFCIHQAVGDDSPAPVLAFRAYTNADFGTGAL